MIVPSAQFMRQLSSKPRRLALSCFQMKTALPQLGTVFAAVLAAGIVSSASAADSFRIDSSTLSVPNDLSDDWSRVKRKGLWSRSNGINLTEDGKFVRFLGRHYVFDYGQTDATTTNTSSSYKFTAKATWFVAGDCVTMVQDLDNIIGSKREALETGLGESLNEIQDSLRSGTVFAKTSTVLWAQFKRKSGQLVSWPVVGLAPKDKELLTPLAEIARDHFENVLLPTADCVEVDNPRSQRELTKTGGRRMAPSSSQLENTQLQNSEDFSPPAGPTNGRSERPSKPTKARKRFAISITQFRAAPGTFSFTVYKSFIRCIHAESKEEARQIALTLYQSKSIVAPPNKPRFSYKVSDPEDALVEENQCSLSEDTQSEELLPFSDPISSMEGETDEPSELDITDTEPFPG